MIIAKILKAGGLTQSEAARRLGVHRVTVCQHVSSSTISSATIERFCEVANVSARYEPGTGWIVEKMGAE